MPRPSTRAMPRVETFVPFTQPRVEPRPKHFEAEIKRLQAEAIAAKESAALAEKTTRELRESIEQQERSRKVCSMILILIVYADVTRCRRMSLRPCAVRIRD